MDAAVQFDAEAHEYRVDGEQYDSVTQVLKPLSERLYRFAKADDMARAAQLGTAVHMLIELDSRGILDESSLDSQLVLYLEKWRQFRAQSGFVPLLNEQIVFSRKWRIAGMLDLFGTLNDEASLIDAKRCAAVPRTAGPQTAGYETLLRECMPDLVARVAKAGRIKRYALHLTPGTRPGWALVPFKDPNDVRVFLSAANLTQWSKAA